MADRNELIEIHYSGDEISSDELRRLASEVDEAIFGLVWSKVRQRRKR